MHELFFLNFYNLLTHILDSKLCNVNKNYFGNNCRYFASRYTDYSGIMKYKLSVSFMLFLGYVLTGILYQGACRFTAGNSGHERYFTTIVTGSLFCARGD